MLKDYKEKYEKCAKELYELKLKVNVRSILVINIE